jgi:hypothetical protein
MSSEPLSPEEVERLLHRDSRTAVADMLVLRDALLRLGDAYERLAGAVGDLQRIVALSEQRMRDRAGEHADADAPAPDRERRREPPGRAD